MTREKNNKVTNLSDMLPGGSRKCDCHSAKLSDDYFVNYDDRILDLLARMFCTQGPNAATFRSDNKVLVFFNSVNEKYNGNFDDQQDNFNKLQRAANGETLDEVELFISLVNNSKIYNSIRGVGQDLCGRIKTIEKLLCSSGTFNDPDFIWDVRSLRSDIKEVSDSNNLWSKLYFEKVPCLIEEFGNLLSRLIAIIKEDEESVLSEKFYKELCDLDNIIGEYLRPYIDVKKALKYFSHEQNLNIQKCDNSYLLEFLNSTVPDSEPIKQELINSLSSNAKFHAELKGMSFFSYKCGDTQFTDLKNSEMKTPDSDINVSVTNSQKYFGSSLLCCAECFVASSLYKKIGFRGTHGCYFNKDAGTPMFLDENNRREYDNIISRLGTSEDICSTADGYLSDDAEYTSPKILRFIKAKRDFGSSLSVLRDVSNTNLEMEIDEKKYVACDELKCSMMLNDQAVYDDSVGFLGEL